MQTKAWYQSRTLRVNALAMIIAAAASSLPELQSAIPGGIYAWLAFALPVANAYLRFVTSTALTAGDEVSS